jgi:FKBP-type peptidyl-prolyl cis-trans isomerase
MRKFYYLTLATAMLFAACSQPFKKGKNGLEYKIVSSGEGAKVKKGDFIQFLLCRIYNNGKTDSLLSDTRKTLDPIINKVDTSQMPKEFVEIFLQMKKGDSLVMRTPSDSILSQSKPWDNLPPYIKKGGYFYTTIKLTDIFSDEKKAEEAFQKGVKLKNNKDSIEYVEKMRKDSIDGIAQMKKEEVVLQDYFKKNNINPIKTPLGAYIQIIEQGKGRAIDTSVVAKINYTGRTMDGKMFDSNTDPSKGHVEPFEVNMTNEPSLGRGVIKGWTECLKQLKDGAKAKFIIPSPLGYGNQDAGEIKANSILIFDIEVVGIMSREQAIAAFESKMKKIREKQQRMQDSLNKASTNANH